MLHHGIVVIGMLIFERKIFEFCFDAIQAQSVCQRREDVERLPHNFILSGGQHGGEGAHIVETVGNLDQNHADIVAHGEQNLLESLRLHRSTIAE